MARWITHARRFFALLSVLYIAAPIIGVRPPDAGDALYWLVGLEQWTTNQVPDPFFYAFLAGLLVSLLSPDLWKLLRYFVGSEGIAAIEITRVTFGTRSVPVLRVSFSVSNPGPPTTFHGWELWVRPPGRESVGVKIEGQLDLGDDNNLGTKPLETGGRRSGACEIFHYALPHDAMQEPRTLFWIRTVDVRNREIVGAHILESVEQELSRSLSPFAGGSNPPPFLEILRPQRYGAAEHDSPTRGERVNFSRVVSERRRRLNG